MPDQQLTAAARLIRAGDPRIDESLRELIAVVLDDATAAFYIGGEYEAALALARELLGQPAE
ncbi:hypothetical protein ABT093_09860 [Kitasatospora sp. NPDC002551]|uniref:hypothetical protein n=1 Tax=Kitasatospora sp. NPDC002551 TaxID=3154539 RepID=UPI0033203243